MIEQTPYRKWVSGVQEKEGEMDSEVRAKLEKAFPQKLIKERRGTGRTLEYYETKIIIQRLNEALEGEWEFSILDVNLLDDQVIVRGKMTVGGMSREQFGVKRLVISKSTKEPMQIGDDTKAAASDCIKKCATLWGVGLELYGDDDLREAEGREDKEAKKGSGSASGGMGEPKEKPDIMPARNGKPSGVHLAFVNTMQRLGYDDNARDEWTEKHFKVRSSKELTDDQLKEAVNTANKAGRYQAKPEPEAQTEIEPPPEYDAELWRSYTAPELKALSVFDLEKLYVDRMRVLKKAGYFKEMEQELNWQKSVTGDRCRSTWSNVQYRKAIQALPKVRDEVPAKDEKAPTAPAEQQSRGLKKIAEDLADRMNVDYDNLLSFSAVAYATPAQATATFNAALTDDAVRATVKAMFDEWEKGK